MIETALYLIPVQLSDVELGTVLPAANIAVVRHIKHFIVENVRSARRFLKKCDRDINIDELSFHALYNEDVYGDVIIKYYAYEERTPDQRVSIVVRFRKSGVGVAENVANLGHAYPNPASSVVHFDYELSASNTVSVSVYNLLGQEVLNQNLNSLQGQVTISVADLNEGIYFCNLVVNGRAVKTEKFVVKK